MAKMQRALAHEQYQPAPLLELDVGRADQEIVKLTPGDGNTTFGSSVSISGDTVAVGAPQGNFGPFGFTTS